MTVSPAWIAVVVAGANFLITVGGLGYALGVIVGRLKTLEAGQEAVWAEIISIKKTLGLSNGGESRFMMRGECSAIHHGLSQEVKLMLQKVVDRHEDHERRLDDDSQRLNNHSSRLRALEITKGGN